MPPKPKLTKEKIANMAYSIIKEEISEKIRLFYVALTRAKEKMIFLLPENNKDIVLASYKDDVKEMTSTAYEKKFGSPMSSATNLLISSNELKI